MSDLVEHLRREASKQDMLTCEDMLRAADEIDRLRAHIERQTEALNVCKGFVHENDRLRVALKEIADLRYDNTSAAAIAQAALADRGKG